MQRLMVALLAVMAMAMTAGEVFANPFKIPNSTGDRVTFRMDGLTPGSEIQVGAGDTKAKLTAYTINNYGRISPPAGATKVRKWGDTTWINLSSATDLTDSVKVATVQGQRQFAPKVAGQNLPTIPSFIKLGTAFYWNPGTTLPTDGIFIEFDVPVQRVAKVNACGQLSISVSSVNGSVNYVPAVTVNGTSYTIASLPVGNPANLSRCVKYGESTYVRYVPQ
ncbi:hypothetical protein [Synechococcus sp. PCC 6312]|uniref:hypothetical protein n=1 Tax=Synechococcus sp. (strain ATCC 27167 / PCC 6312) TaxID=195253 RepID=UPI00029F218F|nr:hypothetical protein [Synechococcus sp. PCC 6312]AFY61965.1 hypothetical protein Syn6312_2902 [Synechococcus sp. PCC 6312]